jgi:hypothetical protein
MKTGVDRLEQGRYYQHHHVIIEWISSTNFPAQQSDLITRRQAETGQWFLASPEFTKWLHEPHGTLFCPGIPGAGKTMMAAITVDHLQRTQSETIGVMYLYCNYKVQIDQTVKDLLAAMLKQLVQTRRSIAETVSRLYEHHFRLNTRPSLEEIFGALQSEFRNYSTVYVVIDALDECLDKDRTRSNLLDNLRNLQRKIDLRLMVTSRFIPDIENEFRSTPTLEVRASDLDVKLFVRGQIYRLPKCVQRDIELQNFVEDKIVDAADGM